MAAEDIENWCAPEHMDAEDPLFILYTSGTTGKPKGVVMSVSAFLNRTRNDFINTDIPVGPDDEDMFSFEIAH